MADRTFNFRVASMGNEDNSIVINCTNPFAKDQDEHIRMVDNNMDTARNLADQMINWLTPHSLGILVLRINDRIHTIEARR